MKKIVLICLYLFLFNMQVSALELSAHSACLMIAETGEVIYAKNENEKKPMASTTKIMTGLLAVESGCMEDIVTASKNAERQEGSSIYLRSGDKIKMGDLVAGLMLNSGNDAAVAIAEHISGNTAEFAEKMTEKAIAAGATNTQFKNPNGLDEAGHYTTAHDLALIAATAMKNEDFYQIVSTQSQTAHLEGGQILYFNNHNKMLKMYNGAVGVKTGFTRASGRCLVSAAQRDGILLIAVTLNAPDDWTDHKNMLDYGFEKVTLKTVVTEGQVLKSVTKDDKTYTFTAAETIKIPAVSNLSAEVKINLPTVIPSSLNKGEKTGIGEVVLNGKDFCRFDIVSAQDIPDSIFFEKKSFTKSIMRTLYAMIHFNTKCKSY